MCKIMIINGPNLNLLGSRQPEIYGSQGFDAYLSELRDKYPNCELHYLQSNHEGDLVEAIQAANEGFSGIVLNPAAYTHTSVAIADAILAIQTPVIEVHISNPKAREPFRHVSYVEAYVIGTISGLGLKGYELAVGFFAEEGRKGS